ncbi:dTDP-4-dehydrorhamnose reductase [Candidatus Epulonipiscium fishelsonii]|uniref:dTDP-4-dehydrorhamnose reductase n=1 Tax=Candidatus Epulonipiscium fishelsonii TaxID=77094 RepID=A0ACC8XD71_9FIRM|nr:dTDP-4-dehydrorhamnose reductase [Epulopiscium sp. SCG-B05WGA-EpuloA1]ONI40799.1 dTDP-4-dehydrorhamnose reductase [Epulopiscium sp. SCG-B11WGA-EpuloA1]
MKIFITGGNGQLGKEVQRQLKEYDLIITDYDTLDISDFNQVEKILYKEKPDVVINCGAYTAVDKCEEEIIQAYKVNALGPRNLAIICEELQAKLVNISTDYVFGDVFIGNTLPERIQVVKTLQPLKEDHPCHPVNVYGKSKLLGEQMVRQFSTKHFILRTAWLYGDGNNFVRTMLNLAKTTDTIKVVADQFGSPTYTKDLVWVIKSLLSTKFYGTYNATCEGICSWYEFACKIFEIENINIKVVPIATEEFPRPAKRPHYSCLDNFMLKLQNLNSFRHWEDALKDYL